VEGIRKETIGRETKKRKATKEGSKRDATISPCGKKNVELSGWGRTSKREKAYRRGGNSEKKI